jgi:hypothetical protein
LRRHLNLREYVATKVFLDWIWLTLAISRFTSFARQMRRVI